MVFRAYPSNVCLDPEAPDYDFTGFRVFAPGLERGSPTIRVTAKEFVRCRGRVR
jgi:hypothetical protein